MGLVPIGCFYFTQRAIDRDLAGEQCVMKMLENVIYNGLEHGDTSTEELVLNIE